MNMPLRILAALALLWPVAMAAEAPSDIIRKGEYLARAGDCIACHTNPGGEPFAGGRPMPTPFGSLFSSNISPDPEYGIGKWSAEQF